jgi:molybdate transport system substrate-binding protein
MNITMVCGAFMAIFRFFRAAIASALLAAAPLTSRAADITVFAAASLTDVLQKTADSYKAKSGQMVALSFAASSVLAKQIESSGGADMFISADKDWMDYLDSKGLIVRSTRGDLLGSHLVMIAPVTSGLQVKIAPSFDIMSALAGGRLAVADPDSVPAGKYAKTALASLGLWNTVVDHLVIAENVRVALAYVARGEAPLGVVYSTDAMAEPRVRIISSFPDSTHAPIVYPAALTKDAKPAAQTFLDFLKRPETADIFAKAGFVVLPRGH